APTITTVDSYVLKGPRGVIGDGSDNDERYELGSVVRFMVYEELDDPHLMGTVRVYSISQAYDTGHKQLTFDDSDKAYYWDWNTTDLLLAEDYRVDTTLQDEWGNKDGDGSIPSGPDLTLTLEDTTAPTIISVRAIELLTGNDNGTYELGSTVRIIVAELYYELGLYGTVRITSNSTSYDSGIQLLKSDINNRTYYWDWDTSQNVAIAEDYAVETTLQDYYNNSDLDGLPITPDLTLKLIDTTAPSSVTDVNIVEDSENPGEVHINWDGMEDGAIVHIYRDTSPFDEDNITSMTPLYSSAPNATSYTDTVSPDGSTYYYAIIIEDSEGNLNGGITDENTDTIKISKPKPSEETEEGFFEGEGLWWLLIIIVIIIIIVILVAVFFITRKRQPITPYEGETYDDEYLEKPPPPPSKTRARKGRTPPRKGPKQKDVDLDWDEQKPDDIRAPKEEPPLHVKPGGRARDYETQDLGEARAALWDDIQDEYGEQPGYMPHGAADYDYDESEDYTHYEDYEQPSTKRVRPTSEAEVDDFGEAEEAEEPEEAEDDEEDEEIFEVEFDEDEEIEEEVEAEADEEAEDGDIDWD
ncbi:MAG: hypothetical protein KAJ51_14150, partial [Thermoplasmata archaeon]|nr:hypothetical protein [Thermoplasmata archaeon]